MTMTKESWRLRWLDSINELTSLDLQINSWLDLVNRNPHWSFVEFRACYFDELFVEYDDYDYQHFIDKGWVTYKECEIIKDWHEALDKYEPPNNDNYNHSAILSDPYWLDIIRTGVKAKNKLEELLNSVEKQNLTQNIDYLKYT